MLDSLPGGAAETGHSQVFPRLCELLARCLPIATGVVIETFDGGSQMTVWCAPEVPRYQRCAAETRAWSSLTHALANHLTKQKVSTSPGPEPNDRYVVIPLNIPNSDTCFVQLEMTGPIDAVAIGFLHHAFHRVCAATTRGTLRRALG